MKLDRESQRRWVSGGAAVAITIVSVSFGLSRAPSRLQTNAPRASSQLALSSESEGNTASPLRPLIAPAKSAALPEMALSPVVPVSAAAAGAAASVAASAAAEVAPKAAPVGASEPPRSRERFAARPPVEGQAPSTARSAALEMPFPSLPFGAAELQRLKPGFPAPTSAENQLLSFWLFALPLLADAERGESTAMSKLQARYCRQLPQLQRQRQRFLLSGSQALEELRALQQAWSTFQRLGEALSRRGMRCAR